MGRVKNFVEKIADDEISAEDIATKFARRMVKPIAQIAEKRAAKQLKKAEKYPERAEKHTKKAEKFKKIAEEIKKLPSTVYPNAILTALKKVVTNSKNSIEENLRIKVSDKKHQVKGFNIRSSKGDLIFTIIMDAPVYNSLVDFDSASYEIIMGDPTLAASELGKKRLKELFSLVSKSFDRNTERELLAAQKNQEERAVLKFLGKYRG